jgi:type VI secretion system secreted protein VgrG
MSQLYAFDVVFRTEDSQLDGLGAVGEPITLEVERRPENILEPPKRWRVHGVVTALEYGGDEGAHALYLLRFAPRLALLGLSQHSRIFTDVTIPQIIAAVLENEGIASDGVRFDLDGTYDKREHVCQYLESSLAFVSRLMEREGLFYFFEHDGDKEVLVIADDFSKYPALACGLVRFVARSEDDASAGDAFVSLAREAVALPGRIVLKDYDELRPSLELGGEGYVQEARPRVVDYGEHLLTPDLANRYARIRAQILAASETRFFARGGVIGVHAGGTFRFAELVGDFPSECLVTEVTHAGARADVEASVRELVGVDFGGGYRTDAVLIPADTQFRAPMVTPWPRVFGVEPALVDGPAESEYAQIDEHGRYKVSFLFDEGDLVDGSRSTWVRMLEPHGGAPDGFHFPLRKGTEVHVAFLGGDPDRPTIAGVAPNAQKPSVITSANATRNILRTGGNNLWELEDQAGAQRVLMSTPSLSTHLHLGAGGHQMELRTDGKGLLHYGQDLDVEVGAEKTEIVASDLRETYRSTHTLSVTGPSLRTLQTSWTQTVNGPVTNTLSSTFTEDIGGFVTEIYEATLSTHAVGAASITDDGSLSLTVSGGLAKETIRPSRNITVGAAGTVTVTGGVEETYGATRRLVHGDLVEKVTGTYTIQAPKMLVYAADASIIDQGINAVEAAASWITAVHKEFIDSGSSFTGLSVCGIGLQLKFVGYRKTSETLGLTIALANIDLALARIKVNAIYVRSKPIRMAIKAIHMIL